jgi:hypothetical protein
MKTTQLQSKAFSRKAKSKSASAKAVKQMQADFEIELAQLKAKQTVAPVAPVIVAAAPTSSIFAGFGQPYTRDDSAFAGDCK